jgi:hypothetical protein
MVMWRIDRDCNGTGAQARRRMDVSKNPNNQTMHPLFEVSTSSAVKGPPDSKAESRRGLMV